MNRSNATPIRDHAILTNSDGTLTALAGEALIHLRSEAHRMGITEAEAWRWIQDKETERIQRRRRRN